MSTERPHDGSGDTYSPPAGVGEVHADLDAQPGQQHDLRALEVTLHAERRFIERVDNSDLFPADRIRREFREAARVDESRYGAVDPVRRHPESGAVYVYDPDTMTVITVLATAGEQTREHDERTEREVAA